jgi:hypothetical protein
LNLRPPGPQPGALPDCATPRGPLRFYVARFGDTCVPGVERIGFSSDSRETGRRGAEGASAKFRAAPCEHAFVSQACGLLRRCDRCGCSTRSQSARWFAPTATVGEPLYALGRPAWPRCNVEVSSSQRSSTKRATGFEPVLKAWKALVQPLTPRPRRPHRIGGSRRLERRNLRRQAANGGAPHERSGDALDTLPFRSSTGTSPD